MCTNVDDCSAVANSSGLLGYFILYQALGESELDGIATRQVTLFLPVSLCLVTRTYIFAADSVVLSLVFFFSFS
jgi:hypothetical protein